MANHASALKRNRQRLKRTARNRSQRSALRTDVKKARTGLEAKPDDADKLLVSAHSALDRAASKGVIPRNRAARLKSRLAKAANKAKTAS